MINITITFHCRIEKTYRSISSIALAAAELLGTPLATPRLTCDCFAVYSTTLANYVSY